MVICSAYGKTAPGHMKVTPQFCAHEEPPFVSNLGVQSSILFCSLSHSLSLLYSALQACFCVLSSSDSLRCEAEFFRDSVFGLPLNSVSQQKARAYSQWQRLYDHVESCWRVFHDEAHMSAWTQEFSCCFSLCPVSAAYVFQHNSYQDYVCTLPNSQMV